MIRLQQRTLFLIIGLKHGARLAHALRAGVDFRSRADRARLAIRPFGRYPSSYGLRQRIIDRDKGCPLQRTNVAAGLTIYPRSGADDPLGLRIADQFALGAFEIAPHLDDLPLKEIACV